MITAGTYPPVSIDLGKDEPGMSGDSAQKGAGYIFKNVSGPFLENVSGPFLENVSGPFLGPFLFLLRYASMMVVLDNRE